MMIALMTVFAVLLGVEEAHALSCDFSLYEGLSVSRGVMDQGFSVRFWESNQVKVFNPKTQEVKPKDAETMRHLHVDTCVDMGWDSEETMEALQQGEAKPVPPAKIVVVETHSSVIEAPVVAKKLAERVDVVEPTKLTFLTSRIIGSGLAALINTQTFVVSYPDWWKVSLKPDPPKPNSYYTYIIAAVIIILASFFILVRLRTFIIRAFRKHSSELLSRSSPPVEPDIPELAVFPVEVPRPMNSEALKVPDALDLFVDEPAEAQAS